MKNFKKVISVVMALAMIISSFTAVSASKFADVADTANYAEAVQVLGALGVVNGVAQENGTFNFEPEKLVTRAEAATMIVGALNLADDAKASAATSQFGDVNSQAAWAAGYVNVGVAQGFIAGYDANTFGPLDNVTYAQLCVMLTQITGYGEYAKAYGGWPTGYTTMAATAGINKGVAVAQDAALTKGQVAMMIWNALVTPKLGVDTYAINGNEYKPQDGKDERDFQTLFSEKFDGYVATVTITKTPASAKDYEEVEFTVTKADWWPEEEAAIPNKTDDELKGIEASFNADVDVNGNYLQSGKAVFVLDEYEEPVMIYFASNGKVKTKEVAADTYYEQDDLGASNKYVNTNKIRFGSTYYKLADKVALYVNGAEYIPEFGVGTAGIEATLDKILGNATGTVKLVKSGDVDYYNAIFVDYYQVAKISSIVDKNDEITISLANPAATIDAAYAITEIKITDEAIEEGKVAVTVTRNGEKADLASLVRGDIIAYAVAFNSDTVVSKKVADPAVINILATDDKASGLVTKADTKEGVYTIGGADYEVVPGKSVSGLEVKATLDLTLDPFGRIFATVKDGSTANYAIALRTDDDDHTITLLLLDGTTKKYNVKADVSLPAIDTKVATKDRVVKYEVKNSTGEISAIEVAKNAEVLTDEAYTAKSARLAGASITATTPIIYAPESDITTAQEAKVAGNYTVYTNEDLVNDTKYDIVMYKEGTYVSLIVITNVGTTFTDASRFAVVVDSANASLTDDGDRIETVEVLYDGGAQTLAFVPGVYAKYGLGQGDAFFFLTNSDGLIDRVFIVYDKSADKTYTLADAIANSIKVENPSATAGDIAAAQAKMLDQTAGVWSYNIWDARHDIVLAKGVVVKVTDNYISFATEAQVAKGELDATLYIKAEGNGIVDYTFSDCAAYIYDASSEDKEIDKYSVADASSIRPSAFDNFEDEDNADHFKGDLAANAHNALAMIVDGEIVAIYVIEK